MEPKKHNMRNGLSVVDINGELDDSFIDSYFEDGDTAFVETLDDDKMNDYDLRIEALKRAIDIAKLMSDVTTDDVITIASTVCNYIRNTQI